MIRFCIEFRWLVSKLQSRWWPCFSRNNRLDSIIDRSTNKSNEPIRRGPREHAKRSPTDRSSTVRMNGKSNKSPNDASNCEWTSVDFLSPIRCPGKDRRRFLSKDSTMHHSLDTIQQSIRWQNKQLIVHLRNLTHPMITEVPVQIDTDTVRVERVPVAVGRTVLSPHSFLRTVEERRFWQSERFFVSPRSERIDIRPGSTEEWWRRCRSTRVKASARLSRRWTENRSVDKENEKTFVRRTLSIMKRQVDGEMNSRAWIPQSMRIWRLADGLPI